MNSEDVKFYMEKIRKSVGRDRGYKYFFIATKNQESRIDCIYPNVVNNEEVTAKLNLLLDDIIKNTNDEK